MLDDQPDNHARHESLESRARGKLAHAVRGADGKARACGTSLAAYPTLREPEGGIPSGHSPCPDPELDLSIHDLARRGLALTQICKWVDGVMNVSPGRVRASPRRWR
jgi:hypothetical protein